MKEGKPIWLFGFFAAIIVSVLLFALVNPDTLHGFEGSLAAVNLSLAVFAINFSFVGYQLSAYRHLYRGISSKQIAASITVLLLGIAAYLVMGFSPRLSPFVALGILPILAFCSVALLMLAKHETNGEVILERMTSSENVKKILDEFAQGIKRDEESLEKISLSKRGEKPTHEYDWKLTPRTNANDPFDTLATIAAIAIKNDDLKTFGRCVETGLRKLDQSIAYAQKNHAEAYRLNQIVRNHAENSLRRIFNVVCEKDKGGTFTRTFQDLAARYVITKADLSKQCSDEVFFVLGLMTKIGNQALDYDVRDLVLSPVIVARQIVQKGVDKPLLANEATGVRSIDVFEFHHALPRLTNSIKQVGHAAIEKKDAEILYRCLDAFGWLGCSAIKCNDHGVGAACLRGLCQLGRESKAGKLECFWSRCALEPWQHAEERIGWILSWLPQQPKDKHNHWLRSIVAAYSRLHGFEFSIESQEDNGELQFQPVVSESPYKSDGSDYSDPASLKDMELY